MAEITTNREALEFLFTSPTTLDELSTNIFQNQSNFRVKVVTPPVFYSGDPGDLESIVLYGSEPGASTKMIFKGRILDSNMAHEKYLRDPCDPAFADDPATAAQLAALHTNIVLNRDEDTENLSIGDIVLCESTAGDNNTLYDLQFMKMTGVYEIVSAEISPATLSDCTNLQDLFGDIPADLNFPDGGNLRAIYGPAAGQIEFDNEICNFSPEDVEDVYGFYLNHPLAVLQQSNSIFNDPGRGSHNGMDFAQDAGVPVYASATGIVYGAVSNCKVGDLECGGQFGNRVFIKHDGGYETRYGHFRNLASGLKDGDVVQRGQVIGYIGTTGYSTGNHLHFELLYNGVYIDPAPYIKIDKCPSDGEGNI
jgi:hypothetical protein